MDKEDANHVQLIIVLNAQAHTYAKLVRLLLVSIKIKVDVHALKDKVWLNLVNVETALSIIVKYVSIHIPKNVSHVQATLLYQQF